MSDGDNDWPGDTVSPGVDDKTNPKDRYGRRRVSISKFPSTAVIHGAAAMQDGAVKYGAYNFRETDVRASLYIDACMRHVLAWFDGEEIAQDSGVKHLGHALADLAIILDAQENGTLIDDRPFPGKASAILKELEKNT